MAKCYLDGKMLRGKHPLEKANVASRFSLKCMQKQYLICSLSKKSLAICKSIFLPRVLEQKVSIDQHQSAYKYVFSIICFFMKKNTQTHIPCGRCLNNVGSTFRPQWPDMPQVTPRFSLCLCFRGARGA